MNPKNGNGPENGERTGTYIPAGVLAGNNRKLEREKTMNATDLSATSKAWLEAEKERETRHVELCEQNGIPEDQRDECTFEDCGICGTPTAVSIEYTAYAPNGDLRCGMCSGGYDGIGGIVRD